ncbi:MAG: peptidoglycan DD-metalloendopeptidase family protein [Gammaproteobacteria bacterium]
MSERQHLVDGPGVYRVQRGDTLFSIAWRYGLDYRDIAAWNGLSSPNRILVDQRLRLTPPGMTGNPIARDSTPHDQPAPLSRAERKPSKHNDNPVASADGGEGVFSSAKMEIVDRRSWQWPTQGRVVRGFKPDALGRKGISISGNIGQPVRAASPGEIVYSGSGLPGYGRLIIVKHSESLLSAYGYLGKMLVKEGDSVKAGQTIAEMGGDNNQAILHFEIRKNGKPIDPMRYLRS